ncbi:F-box domain protein [Aspergillus lucknowensis]|uniref:F-box domain protein n=1 Tax=Aspergillus lucknowensis TaxID=176173 RepID=A0ABR4LUM7_9EURO
MALTTSPIESLPNELLDEVILLLATPPPSCERLHHPPSVQITRSGNRDLKNLSLTCSRLLDLVRPRLFSHSCFELRDVDRYIEFISLGLCGCVTSIVVKKGAVSDDTPVSEPLWWRRLFRRVRPLRFTVLAPPSFIKELLGMQMPEEHGWAFEIPLQLLQLECDRRDPNPALASQVDKQLGLLDCAPWSSLLFNESSSIKAYNHYEYFLYQVPSLFHRWGSLTSNQTLSERPRLFSSLENLTSFTYVAVFPFYNHVQLVLDAVELMKNLRSLSIQLGPSRNDRVTELEQRGSMDPSDPWMELATGYSLIAHAVRNLGKTSRLSVFTACDYRMDAVRAEIDVILGDILCDGSWRHNGHGTWARTTTERSDVQRTRQR